MVRTHPTHAYSLFLTDLNNISQSGLKCLASICYESLISNNFNCNHVEATLWHISAWLCKALCRIWKVCIRHIILSEQGPHGKAGGNKRATIRTGDYTKPTPPPICILKDVLWGRELDFCLLHCLAKQVSLYRIVWVRMDKWVKHFKDVNWMNWGLISQNVSKL